MVVIPVVLHLDLDAFFIQVERHRLPTLRAPTPCALQQHQDIIAVSYEARALGVAKHMRPAEVRRRFPDVRLVHVATVGDSGKVTYRAYRQASKNIFTLVASHCATLEKASIDEAFLGPSLDDLAPHLPPATRAAAAAAACAAADAPPHHEVDPPSPWSEGLRNQLLEAGGALAREIQAALCEQLQYECSIGVAENKLLARLAVRSAKPCGIHVLRPAAVPALLAATPFTRLQGYGAGSAAARAVAALGAIHLADLARLGAAALAHAEGVGPAAAAALAAAGAGVDGSAVAPRPPPASIQSQTSLTPKPVAALCMGRPQDTLQPIGAHETERLRYHMAVLAADVLERAEEDAAENARIPTAIITSYHLAGAGQKSRRMPLPRAAAAAAPGRSSPPLPLPPEDQLVELALTPLRELAVADAAAAAANHSGSSGGGGGSSGTPVVRLGLSLTGFVPWGRRRQRSVRDALLQQGATAAVSGSGGSGGGGDSGGSGNGSGGGGNGSGISRSAGASNDDGSGVSGSAGAGYGGANHDEQHHAASGSSASPPTGHGSSALQGLLRGVNGSGIGATNDGDSGVHNNADNKTGGGPAPASRSSANGSANALSAPAAAASALPAAAAAAPELLQADAENAAVRRGSPSLAPPPPPPVPSLDMLTFLKCVECLALLERGRASAHRCGRRSAAAAAAAGSARKRPLSPAADDGGTSIELASGSIGGGGSSGGGMDSPSSPMEWGSVGGDGGSGGGGSNRHEFARVLEKRDRGSVKLSRLLPLLSSAADAAAFVESRGLAADAQRLFGWAVGCAGSGGGGGDG